MVLVFQRFLDSDFAWLKDRDHSTEFMEYCVILFPPIKSVPKSLVVHCFSCIIAKCVQCNFLFHYTRPNHKVNLFQKADKYLFFLFCD